MKKVSHFENDFSEYGLKSLNLRKTGFQLGIHLGIRADEELITHKIETIAMHKEGKKENELFGIGAIFAYKIKNFENLFPKNRKNQYGIPDELVIMLLGMSISGIRGMLIGSNTKPEYNKIILPPINTKQLLIDYQKNIKSSDN